MKGAGLSALAAFLLFNVAQSSPWALDEFQQGVLMVIGLFAAAVALREVFPDRPRRKVVTQYVEVPVIVTDTEKEGPPFGQPVPNYGTPSGPGNPNQGKPEHNRYGC